MRGLRMIVALLAATSVAGCGGQVPSLRPTTSIAPLGTASATALATSSAPTAATPGGTIIGRLALDPEGLGVGDLTVGGDAAWVTMSGAPDGRTVTDGHLYMVAPERDTIVSDLRVGWAPGSIAVGGGSVWIAETNGDGSMPQLADQADIARVDVSDMRVATRIAAPVPGPLLFAAGRLWAGSVGATGGRFLIVDPATNAAATLQVPGDVAWLAVAGGLIWSGLTGSGSAGPLVRVDPTSRSTTMVDVGAPVRSLLSSHVRSWAVIGVGDSSDLRPFDPVRGALTGPPVLPLAADREAMGSDTLWAIQGDLLQGWAAPSFLPLGKPVPLGLREGDSVVDMAVDGGDVWILTGSELIHVRAVPTR